MSENDRINYVDLIAPHHSRRSCNDNNLLNHSNYEDDNHCPRCTMLMAATVGMSDGLIDNIMEDRELGYYE